MNTREYRTRKALEEDRHEKIQKLLILNTAYKPPPDYKYAYQVFSQIYKFRLVTYFVGVLPSFINKNNVNYALTLLFDTSLDSIIIQISQGWFLGNNIINHVWNCLLYTCYNAKYLRSCLPTEEYSTVSVKPVRGQQLISTE